MNTAQRRMTGWIAGGIAAAVVCTGGIAIGASTAGAGPTTTANLAWYYPSGDGSGYGFGPGWDGQGAPQTTTASDGISPATATQQKGVVIIDTLLGNSGGAAAGTGIVLSSSGEILTNKHVIAGATSIRVTIASTGRSYDADVVGAASNNDIAVLQLQGASGLDTATLDKGEGVAVGDDVTAVGNAGGTGSLVQASGSVTGLDRSITTQAEGASPSEDLQGLIETDANIQPGDSGGPLYDSQGEVVGIDTAASADPVQHDGYAIPIEDAVAIAKQLENGQSGSDQPQTPTNGERGYLGIGVEDTPYGPGVAQVYDGTPAAAAGLAAGDVILGVDGAAVSSADELSSALAAHQAGDTVRITWMDATGTTNSADVELIAVTAG